MRMAGSVVRATVSRCAVLYWVVVVSAVGLAATAASGLVLWLALPRGGGRWNWSTSAELLGLGRQGWLDLHVVASLGFLVLMVAHVVLHTTWIVRETRRRALSAGRRRSGERCGSEVS